MRKMLPYVLLVSSLACAAAGYCLWRSGHDPSGPDAMVVWERGALRVSEQAYHVDRIRRAVHAWQQMSWEAARSAEQHPDEPYEVCLVIDTAKPALWIEDAGQILERFYVALPDSVAWKAERLDANGLEDLGQTVRLKCPGGDEARFRPEYVVIEGHAQTGVSFAFEFDCTTSTGGSYVKGAYGFTSNIPPLRNDRDYYGSLIVSGDPRNPSARSWSHRNARRPAEQTAPFQENWIAWSNVETKLYRAIEGQVAHAGWTLAQLTVVPYWDYSAADAQVHAYRRNLKERLLGGGTSAVPHLRIDYLGDGVWYARNVRDLHWPARPRGKWEELPLEFLISADQPVPPAERQKWIDKGRTNRDGVAAPQP